MSGTFDPHVDPRLILAGLPIGENPGGKIPVNINTHLYW